MCNIYFLSHIVLICWVWMKRGKKNQKHTEREWMLPVGLLALYWHFYFDCNIICYCVLFKHIVALSNFGIMPRNLFIWLLNRKQSLCPKYHRSVDWCLAVGGDGGANGTILSDYLGLCDQIYFSTKKCVCQHQKFFILNSMEWVEIEISLQGCWVKDRDAKWNREKENEIERKREREWNREKENETERKRTKPRERERWIRDIDITFQFIEKIIEN